MRHRYPVAAAFACAALVACSSKNDSSYTDSAAGTAGVVPGAVPAPADSDASTPVPPSAMNDANILALQQAADSSEVTVASYVRLHTKNPAVKDYAQLLVRDHAKGISNVEATAKKSNIAMQVPAGDTTMQATEHTLDRLKSLSGTDLDTAFVNQEIADHQHDIAETKELITSAQNPEVKSLLEKTVSELQEHLDKAQALSKKLSGGKS
jgi:putative membrane protein